MTCTSPGTPKGSASVCAAPAPCNISAPVGAIVGTCEPTARCKACQHPLPAPPGQFAPWGSWKCTACGAGHCHDGVYPGPPCGALLDWNDECPVVRATFAEDRAYFILSVKYSKPSEKKFTFWRANDSGYVWALSGAGRYPESAIRANPTYYDEGHTAAVPCEDVKALMDVDGFVPYSAANKRALLAAAKRARAARGAQ